MPTVLIDTDVAIDFLRGKEYARDLILPLWRRDAAFISVLSVYELFAGMREAERAHTNSLINACNVEPVTIAIAEKGGDMYRRYREKGVTLTTSDCLIAATAVAEGHKIATRNVRHYPDRKLLLKIPGSL